MWAAVIPHGQQKLLKCKKQNQKQANKQINKKINLLDQHVPDLPSNIYINENRQVSLTQGCVYF